MKWRTWLACLHQANKSPKQPPEQSVSGGGSWQEEVAEQSTGNALNNRFLLVERLETRDRRTITEQSPEQSISGARTSRSGGVKERTEEVKYASLYLGPYGRSDSAPETDCSGDCSVIVR